MNGCWPWLVLLLPELMGGGCFEVGCWAMGQAGYHCRPTSLTIAVDIATDHHDVGVRQKPPKVTDVSIIRAYFSGELAAR